MQEWLLTPLAGMVADRFSRRNLLIYSQALGILLAALMLVLLLAEMLEVWHIIVLTLLRGINFALDFPVRYALVVDLVAPKEQLNAVSLNRASYGYYCRPRPCSRRRIDGPAGLCRRLLADAGS